VIELDHRLGIAREQPIGFGLGQRLDVAQLARDRRALAARIVERLTDLVELLLGLRENLAELVEFGLDRRPARARPRSSAARSPACESRAAARSALPRDWWGPAIITL
jgi:hypothetical protein